MNDKYNLIKLLVGMFDIAYLLYVGTSYRAIHSGLWWKYLIVALIILLILLKWVTFADKNESLWSFVITLFVVLPCNIRVSYIVISEYFYIMNLFSRVLYAIVFCMCLISAEEILVGILTRIIWHKQEDVIYIEE